MTGLCDFLRNAWRVDCDAEPPLDDPAAGVYPPERYSGLLDCAIESDSADQMGERVVVNKTAQAITCALFL